MTILAIGYDVYAIIFIAVLAAVLIVLFSRGYKSSRENKAGDAEDVTENTLESEDVQEDDEDDDEEPEIVETHGCITHKECYSGMNSSIKHRHAYKNFIINFRSDDGEDFEYSIDEDTYLSIEEGDFGYVAVVGKRFYGYCSDKDAADETKEENSVD